MLYCSRYESKLFQGLRSNCAQLIKRIVYLNYNQSYSGNNMATENFAVYVVRILQIVRITETVLPSQKC